MVSPHYSKNSAYYSKTMLMYLLFPKYDGILGSGLIVDTCSCKGQRMHDIVLVYTMSVSRLLAQSFVNITHSYVHMPWYIRLVHVCESIA